MNSEAVAQVSQALPLIVPADPRHVTVEELMASCDGFLLPGGRPNVHPEEYGDEPTEAHGAFDRARDALALPLIRACVERGQPILGICRGFQEVNVAMGGTLHPEIRDLPGRMNHRMPPDGTLEEKFAIRHAVTFTEGGPFHRLFGARRGDDQHAARPGDRGSRAARCHRRPGRGRHARGDLHRRRAGLRAGGAVAPRMAGGDRPGLAPALRGVRRGVSRLDVRSPDPGAALGMKPAPGTRHRKLVLIALGIGVVLVVAALLWNAPPLVEPAPPVE